MKPNENVTYTTYTLSDNGVITMWIIATTLAAGRLIPALSVLEKLLPGNETVVKLCRDVRSKAEDILRKYCVTEVPKDADPHLNAIKNIAALYAIVPDDRLSLDMAARNRLWVRCFSAANTGSIDPLLLEAGDMSPAECAEAIRYCAEKADMWVKTYDIIDPDAAIIAENLRELDTFAEGIRGMQEEAPEKCTGMISMKIPETWKAAAYLEYYPDTEKAKEKIRLLEERYKNRVFDSREVEEEVMREYGYTGDKYPALLAYSFVTGLFTAEFYKLVNYIYGQFPVMRPYYDSESIEMFDPEKDDADMYDYECEELSLPDLVTRVRMRSLKEAAARNGFSEESLRKAAAISAYLPDRHGDTSPDGDAEAWKKCMELAATMKITDDRPYEPDIRECIDLLDRYCERTDEWQKTYHPEVYKPGEIEDKNTDDITSIRISLEGLREELEGISK